MNPQTLQLSHTEFERIRQFLHQQTGIQLADGKQALVVSRLGKRVREFGFGSYGDYFRWALAPGQEGELRHFLDVMTTNETYFFREEQHFEFLRQQVLKGWPYGQPFRAWSAASSSGEEAYTLAMVLAEQLRGGNWEIIGTDLSSRVLETARRGLYPLTAAAKIPAESLRRFCLRGSGDYEGFLLIGRELRDKVRFEQANLVDSLPKLGQFDVIFLRNVMIYFDARTKQRLVERILEHLRPGGYFIISHTETLNGIHSPLQTVKPSIYRLPEAGMR